MVFFIAFLSICLAGFLEAAVIPIPLTLLVILFVGIFQRKEWAFFLAVIAGCIVDSLTFRPLGISSIFFLITLGIVFLYARKFETHHFLFLFLATVATSLVYEACFDTGNMVPATILISMLSAIAFLCYTFLQDRLNLGSN